MHHNLWMTILVHFVMCKAKDVVVKFVQGLILYWLAVRFVAVFIASYVSQRQLEVVGSPATR
jgi:hypothetical protein